MTCFILLSSTYPFSCSVGCFHSRNKLIGRGRETQVKWEQKRGRSCQHKKRNGKKPPRNQRSWKHPGSLPPLITAIPTSKCLQVRSDPLLECCSCGKCYQLSLEKAVWVWVPMQSRLLHAYLVVQKFFKKLTWGMYTWVSLYWFGNKILKQLAKWVVHLDVYFLLSV